jgi:hypothetical protein
MGTETPLLIPECRTCPVLERNRELQRQLAEAQGNATAAAGIAASALEGIATHADERASAVTRGRRRRAQGGGIE